MMPDPVELHPAWTFCCHECGRNSFINAVVPESLEGQLPEGFDAESFDGVEWITKPTTVECFHCGEVFRVEEPDA